jgi:NitT/TauT family transport system ATP-binding protein/nitrate/nitrite transport system substrate-binding protein
MSDAVSSARSGRTIALGLLRLTDSAPAIVAYEFGFFADEGLDVALSVEPSWANIADKLAYRALDAAIVVPPLAFAVSLGLRGPPEPLIIPYAVSLGGNTITLARNLAEELRQEARETGFAAALAARLRRLESERTLAVVLDYSTHNLLLRYWLAAAGAEAGRDFDLCVTPPARTVEALRSRRILGFCAGAPWGEIAERAGVGVTVATSDGVWRNAPEKALAVRALWSEERPADLRGLLRAFYRAARFCDAPHNSSYVAALLSRRAWLGVDSHAILSSLPGTLGARNQTRFHAHAATFPWRSHALWFLAQMTRWGLIEPGLPLHAIAERVYRPDLYADALAPVGASIPAFDRKREGDHGAAWSLPATPDPIAMSADRFCDGEVFDPEAAL